MVVLNLTEREIKAIQYMRVCLATDGQLPSVRGLEAALDYHSSNSAYEVFRTLASKGILRSNNGRWQLLKDPLEHAAGVRTVALPVFMTGRFFPKGFSRGEAEGVLSAATDLVSCPDDCFLVWANDDSASGAGIRHRDMVLAVARQRPRNGDLVAVLVDGTLAIRAYRESGDEATLETVPLRHWRDAQVVTRQLKLEGVIRHKVSFVDDKSGERYAQCPPKEVYLYLTERPPSGKPE
jgi:SOS-response transcriptional repressor LexA